MTDNQQQQRSPWEGVYLVPDLKLDVCPWCRQPSDVFYIIVFELNSETHEVLCEPVCKLHMEVAGNAYINMRKTGLSRKAVLRDFGYKV